MSILKAVSSVLSDGFDTVDEVGAYGDVTGFIDTGSYSLNALVSGSIFGGFASNKITGIAGEKSTGKTFYAIQAMKGHLDADSENEVLIFDSESAITSDQLIDHGIDPARVGVEPVATVEEFRTKAMNVLAKYHEMILPHLKKNKWKAPPPKLMIVLDSLGNLSTTKEVADISSGTDKRDMTKQQLLKGAFRVLTIECGKLNVPMIVTAHTYAAIGCLDPTTLILMADNSLVPISEIRPGDEVKTTYGTGEVGEIYKYEDTECFELELENGETMICTKDHKFLTQKLEWKRSEDLQEGDVIMLIDMIPQKIVAKRVVSPRTVHDFEVKDAHHYILSNGVISHNSYVPTQTVGGGTGMQYAVSTLLMSSKSYDKDDKITTGSKIKFVTEKSRLTRERQKVETLLRYDGGIDRYFGLLPFAEEAGIFKKVSTRYELPDGSKAFEKSILNNPEKYFTQEILEQIDEWCAKRFKYVSGAISEADSAAEESGEEESKSED